MTLLQHLTPKFLVTLLFILLLMLLFLVGYTMYVQWDILHQAGVIT